MGTEICRLGGGTFLAAVRIRHGSGAHLVADSELMPSVINKERERRGNEDSDSDYGAGERERKGRRIGGNLRPRNPAFSLRRLKINATTHSLSSLLSIAFALHPSLSAARRRLYPLSIFSPLPSRSSARILSPSRSFIAERLA